MRFRVRQCGERVCSSQRQECNKQDCNPEPGLRGELICARVLCGCM